MYLDLTYRIHTILIINCILFRWDYVKASCNNEHVLFEKDNTTGVTSEAGAAFPC